MKECLDFCVGEGRLGFVVAPMFLMIWALVRIFAWAGIGNLDLCIGGRMFGFLCW